MSKILDLMKKHHNLQVMLDRYPGLRRFLSRRYQDAGLEVAPYLYTNDEVWRKFVNEEIRLLEESGNFDPKYIDGVVANAVNGGYDRMRTVPGMHQHPRPEGITDNLAEREKLKLPKNFLSDRAEKIMEEVFVCMTLRRKDASLPVNAKSISGPPFFEKDPGIKLSYMVKFLEYVKKNGHRKPTLAELAANEFYLFAVIGYRSQVDEIKKVREVSLSDGSSVKAEKKTEWGGFVRTRERAVYAFSSDINLAYQSLWCGIQKFCFEEYEKTFKVRFAQDAADRMNRFAYHCTVDVTGFDRTVPDFILEYFLELCEKYEVLNTCALHILRLLLGAPAYAPSPHLEPREWGDGKDPLDEANYYLRRGLLSGIFCVTFLGRWIMTGEMLIKLDHVNHKVLGNVEDYLHHNMDDAAFINATDDNFCGTNSQALLDAWIDAPGHFDVKKEPFLAFLGYFYNNENGKLVPYPNIINLMFVNRENPEHSIGNDEGDRRAGWNTGWKMVKDLAMTHPLFNEAHTIKNKAMLHATDGKYDYEGMMLRKIEPLKISTALTDEDKWFLVNPDSIHYKIDVDNVSPELLALRSVAQDPKLTTDWAKVMAGSGIIWM